MISSISTIGNYEYASYWYLHQDGRIEYEMKATGIINTAGCVPASRENLAPRWRRALWATFISTFSARLDMEVDGPNNTVTECDTIALPVGPENPYGNAYYVQETALKTEARHNVTSTFQDALLENHQSQYHQLGRQANRVQTRGQVSSAPVYPSG